MTIREAIKSKRRFRRPKLGNGWMSENYASFTLSKEDILADDWEIEPEVYEFECEFKNDVYIGIYPVGYGMGSHLFPVPLNKKCRVRVEIIE